MLRQFAYLSVNNKRKTKQREKLTLFHQSRIGIICGFTFLAFYLHGYLMHFIVQSCSCILP